MARSLAMATRGKQVGTEKLSYLAGMLDADGCISISKMKAGKQRTANPRYVLGLNVTNTSLSLMNWLIEHFGGRYKARKQLLPHHKITYSWFYENGKAAEVLRLVKPFLVIKEKQASVGIELVDGWKTPTGGQGAQTSKEEIERREGLWLLMKALNQTGCAAATTNSPSSFSTPEKDDVIV